MRKNVLTYFTVMVGGPETMTKRYPQQWSRPWSQGMISSGLLCAQTPPSTRLKPQNIMKRYGKYTNYFSHCTTRNTLLTNSYTQQEPLPPPRTQFLCGYTHVYAPQYHAIASPNSFMTPLSSLPPPHKKPRTITPKSEVYNSLNSWYAESVIPSLQRKN